MCAAIMIFNVCVIVQLFIINLSLALSQQPPNIVLIIADDLVCINNCQFENTFLHVIHMLYTVKSHHIP